MSKRYRKTGGQRQTADAFTNAPARLGFGQPNLLEATEYPLTRLTQDFQLMTSLYRSHWVVRRLIDAVPEDATKAWYKITSQMPPESMNRIARAERRTQVRRKLTDGLRWARLYGGALGVMMISGHEDMLEEPLDFDAVLPGSFQGILLAERWSGVEPSAELETDISCTDFGLPMFYNFEDGVGNRMRVHHSRVLRFVGRQLPLWERQAEQYWGASELEHVFDELKKRDNTSWNIAQLIFQANLRVTKMEGLGELLASSSPKAQEQLYRVLSSQNWLMGNMGMQVMDSKDGFETHQYSFSGLSDIYDKFMLDVAGAAEMPVTKLFGRAPAGMNATGESDLQNYYDSIETKQEDDLRPVLEKLLPVLCLSELGAVPDDLEFQFNPVRRPSDEEKRDLASKGTTSIVEAFNAGVIDHQTALKELRQMSEFTGQWSNITDEMIERASSEFEPAGEELPGGMGAMGFGLPQGMAQDAKWKEEDHPRRENGQFGKGGSSRGGGLGREGLSRLGKPAGSSHSKEERGSAKKGGGAGRNKAPEPGLSRVEPDKGDWNFREQGWKGRSTKAPTTDPRKAINPKGKEITKSYNPDDYENLTVGSADNTERQECGGIQEKKRLTDHHKRHGKEMGFKNEREYNEAGVEFLSKPLSENMEEIIANGKRLRYDYSTNELGVVNPDGNMSTYFWPDEGHKFWEGRIRELGSKKR